MVTSIPGEPRARTVRGKTQFGGPGPESQEPRTKTVRVKTCFDELRTKTV
jgi:hypothetical protein